MRAIVPVTIVCIFMALTSPVYSQIDLDNLSPHIKYGKISQGSMSVVFNFGAENNTVRGVKKNGNKVRFSSVIDALNFMVNNGWEYVSGHENDFLLRRKN